MSPVRRLRRPLAAAVTVLAGAALSPVAVGGTEAMALAGGGMAMMGGGSGGGSVTITFDAYAPAKISVLSGEAVTWTDDSRAHTVTASDGSFDSGRLIAGDAFRHTFASAGTYAYACQLHPFMTGEVDVSDLLLDPPPGEVAPGRSFPLRGRSALPAGSAVTVEADSGAGFVAVGTGVVADDGTFAASVRLHTSATVRGRSGTSLSPTRLVRVDDRHLTVATAHGSLVVRVTPADPGGTVALQYLLRERFGWWPQATARLDRTGRAAFRLPAARTAAVSARVALTLADGATVLALSPVLRARPAPAASGTPGPTRRAAAPRRR